MTKEEIERMRVFFPSTGYALLSEYPELSSYPEFKQLKAYELIFVYLYACSSSPLLMNGVDVDEERVRISIEHIEDNMHYSFSDKLKNEYMNKRFPTIINEAISRMRSFNTLARVRAKVALNKIVSNLESIIDERPDDNMFKNASGELDWAKKRAYSQTMLDIAEDLDKLIKKQEEGYSTKEVSVAQESKFINRIEHYVKNKT
jgi:hypothetical protein